MAWLGLVKRALGRPLGELAAFGGATAAVTADLQRAEVGSAAPGWKAPEKPPTTTAPAAPAAKAPAPGAMVTSSLAEGAPAPGSPAGSAGAGGEGRGEGGGKEEEAEAAAVTPSSRCYECGKKSKLRCSKCKQVKYCSTECQRAHWAVHRKECVGPRGKAPKGGGGAAANGAASGAERTPPAEKAAAATPDEPPEEAPQPEHVLCPYDVLRALAGGRTLTVPTGLRNVGNTCFANAALQCLAYTPAFLGYLRSEAHRRSCVKPAGSWCALCEIQDTFLNYVEADGGAISPRSFLRGIQKIGKHFTYGYQEDSHDFVLQVLDAVQVILLEEYGGEEHLPARTQESSLVWHIFGGYTRNQVVCTECDHVSKTFDGHLSLELQLPRGVDSLEEALQAYVEEETLDGDNKYHCDRCQGKVVGQKSMKIEVAPNVLQIALKRYSMGYFSSPLGSKLKKRVSFDTVLDLAPCMAKGCVDGRPTTYKLYAIIVHIGGMGGGHYISYVKNDVGRWFCCDDSTVSKVDEGEVLAQSAYMLFYRRDTLRVAPVPTGKGEAPVQVAGPLTAGANGRHPGTAPPEDIAGALHEFLDEGFSLRAAFDNEAEEEASTSQAPGPPATANGHAHPNGHGGPAVNGDRLHGNGLATGLAKGHAGPPATPEFFVKLREEEEAEATDTLILCVKLPGVEGAGDCRVHSSAGPLTVSVDSRYELQLGEPYSNFEQRRVVFVKKKSTLKIELVVPKGFTPTPSHLSAEAQASRTKKGLSAKANGKALTPSKTKGGKGAKAQKAYNAVKVKVKA